ncbi:hypothetical protein LC612_06820 [Nostoc sp. CHAB 5834]|nr:hypothetical protein [Nostoc sp. CHAB 5834]
MNIEEALKLSDVIVFAKTEKNLNNVQMAVLQGAWENWTYEDIAANYHCTPEYLKQDVGPKLWKILSEGLGQKVNKKNFRTTLELEALQRDVSMLQRRAEHQAKIANKHQDWGDAPDVSVFFGRTEELATLEKWILQDRYRLVAILGMGGIGKTGLSLKLGKGGLGKTDLSLKLALGIQGEFEYVIWRSLLNAPPVTDILADIIKFLSNQQEINLPKIVDSQIQRLLYYLRQHRCLLILDNMDAVLQGGERAGQYQEGYAEYGKLLTQVGKVYHQSCLLLTSREKPQEIARLAGKNRPVQCLELGGLGYLDGRKIFTEFGDFLGSNDEWKELIEFYYNGNPLALELAAKHVEEVFDGNISEFLRQGKKVFHDMRQDLLNWHFERLSKEEKEVVYWLAINREPISVSDMREDILSPEAKEKVPDTLQSLKRRLPLERSSLGFTLQPVLIEYMTDRLIEQVCEEIRIGKIELLNSHALLKAVAKDYIRESQSRFILKPIQDRLIAILGCQTSLEAQSKQILSMLRERFSQTVGYSGGNILNLLCHLKTDLRGYDFSSLRIWQAYLQEVDLNNVNFAHANFVKSVFTQTFGSILSVVFSPDATLLATSDDKSEIHLWKVVDGQQLLIFRGHTNWVWSIAFSPDGQTLASGSVDKTVKLWDVSTGQCLNTLQGHINSIGSIAFSPDGQTLASGSVDQTVKLWDISTGQCLNTLQEHTNAVWSVAFSLDGQTLASGSVDQTVKLWDVNTGQCLNTLREHTNTIWSVAFSPNGQTLASGSEDQTVKLWNVSTGQCLNTLQEHTNAVWPITFSSDGQTLASGSVDKTIRLWDVGTGRCLNTLQGHTSSVLSVAFCPVRDLSSEEMRQILVSGSYDQTIKLWDTCNGRCFRTLQGHNNTIWSVAFSPDGQTLASGSVNRIVRLWDISTGQCLNTLQGHTNLVCSVAFSPDSQTLASGSEDRTIKLWNVATGQCLNTLQGHTDWVWSVAFSPNGQILASSSSDQTIKLWDVVTGQCFNTLQGHTDWIWSVAFSPNSQILASSCYDQTIKLWDVVSGQCLNTLQGHTNSVTSVAFSPDSQTLASSSYDQTIRLWNVITGQCLKTLQGHTNWVWSVAFSPDGQTLASSSDDGTVKFWNIRTGECLNTLEKYTSRIRSIAFSPDGSMLVSSGAEETLNLWDVKTSKCLKTLRAPRPYEGMNITGITGLTEAQKATMKVLGAVENRPVAS